ncbi:MAG: rRNA maturation RNase YbeY [Myxococcales bacterium]|nr:rRNA maturation RNase YbeY [Myxococcales bacterium]
MSVRLSGLRGLPALDRRRLRGRVQRMLRALEMPDAEISISLVDDSAISELNAAYRKKQGATDVLSFSLLEGEHSERRGALLGDVVVSLETAARQAARGGRSLDQEVMRLLIHGALHLLGHDHQQAGEARRMRAEERRLWRLLWP